MSMKSKGTNAERQLLHMFWAKGWACLRSAGSGSMKYPGPDLLVGSKEKNRRLAIECKTTSKDKLYLGDYDFNQLKEFSDIFDSTAYFAIKFPKKEWLFLRLDELMRSKKHTISIDYAELNGILISELLSYEIK